MRSAQRPRHQAFEQGPPGLTFCHPAAKVRYRTVESIKYARVVGCVQGSHAGHSAREAEYDIIVTPNYHRTGSTSACECGMVVVISMAQYLQRMVHYAASRAQTTDSVRYIRTSRIEFDMPEVHLELLCSRARTASASPDPPTSSSDSCSAPHASSIICSCACARIKHYAFDMSQRVVAMSSIVATTVAITHPMGVNGVARALVSLEREPSVRKRKLRKLIKLAIYRTPKPQTPW